MHDINDMLMILIDIACSIPVLLSLPIGQLLAELVEVALVMGLPELASRVADSEEDLAADGHTDRR